MFHTQSRPNRQVRQQWKCTRGRAAGKQYAGLHGSSKTIHLVVNCLACTHLRKCMQPSLTIVGKGTVRGRLFQGLTYAQSAAVE
jgi:hypothetical protein